MQEVEAKRSDPIRRKRRMLLLKACVYFIVGSIVYSTDLLVVLYLLQPLSRKAGIALGDYTWMSIRILQMLAGYSLGCLSALRYLQSKGRGGAWRRWSILSWYALLLYLFLQRRCEICQSLSGWGERECRSCGAPV